MLLFWDQLNQLELKELFKDSIVAIVVSSLEQHAYHLPTGTDRIIGENICQEVARKSSQKIIMMPSIHYGFSAHHMKFPGSITLKQAHLIFVLTDIFKSLENNGCKEVIVFNSHGGNSSAIKVAINEMHNCFNGDIFLIEYWNFLKKYIDGIRESPIGGIGHAGEMETSLMMHFCPNLVNLSNDYGYSLARNYKGTNPDMFSEKKVYMFRDFSTISEFGNVGVVSYCSAEKGKAIYSVTTDEIVSFIDQNF